MSPREPILPYVELIESVTAVDGGVPVGQVASAYHPETGAQLHVWEQGGYLWSVLREASTPAPTRLGPGSHPDLVTDDSLGTVRLLYLCDGQLFTRTGSWGAGAEGAGAIFTPWELPGALVFSAHVPLGHAASAELTPDSVRPAAPPIKVHEAIDCGGRLEARVQRATRPAPFAARGALRIAAWAEANRRASDRPPRALAPVGVREIVRVGDRSTASAVLTSVTEKD
jgi:hypothetical protein